VQFFAETYTFETFGKFFTEFREIFPSLVADQQRYGSHYIRQLMTAMQLNANAIMLRVSSK